MAASSENAKYILVSVPGGPRAWDDLRSCVARYGETYMMNIPSLRVGTLDSLMSLSDELAKTDAFIESAVRKIARQIDELVEHNPHTRYELLTADERTTDSYITNFQWDEAKFPKNASLPDLCDVIRKLVSRIETAMRQKFTDYQEIRTKLGQLNRKKEGTLIVRSIDRELEVADLNDTAHLIDVLVVVGESRAREFLESYETVNSWVVPRSAKEVVSDEQHTVYAVTVFKTHEDEIKRALREERYHIREWQLSEEARDAMISEADRPVIEEEFRAQEEFLTRWCTTNFGETFIAWIHLKAIRTFIESVLRFSLPPDYVAALILPAKRTNMDSIREALAGQYSDLVGFEDDADAGGFGGGDFFPYVSFDVDLALWKQRSPFLGWAGLWCRPRLV